MEKSELIVNTKDDLFNLLEEVPEDFNIRKHEGTWIAESINYKIVLIKP